MGNAVTPAPVARRGPPEIIRSLGSRNYRLFFGGQSVSLIGTWMTRVATSWLVYRLTHSVWLLGVVGFCGQVPTLVAAPMAGVLVDRWNRHRILVVTQVLSLLQSAALAVLTLGGWITVEHIIVLQVVQGLINGFDTPARQSFLVEMVDNRADLPNAIALNSTMVNGSRIIGPSIAGMLIAAAGEGWCFAIDAISYLAVIGSLVAMRFTRVPTLRPEARLADELRAGISYVVGFVPVRSLLVLLSLVSLLGVPYTVLMPAMASTVLHGGAHTLGFLMTASGAGAVVGALYLASRPSVRGLVAKVMPIATALFGIGLVVFGLSRNVWISLLVMPVVGGGLMVVLAATNTVLQTVVEERLRGRIMAFYTMAFFGTAPFGSLLAGTFAQRIGPAHTILLGGVVTLLTAGWFMRQIPLIRPLIRPIYIERGIIVPTPVSSAAVAADVDVGTKTL